jgi:uncharacterized membrane protein YdbT with pleckstrin-like domain
MLCLSVFVPISQQFFVSCVTTIINHDNFEVKGYVVLFRHIYLFIRHAIAWCISHEPLVRHYDD